jgi:hypothetical protein
MNVLLVKLDSCEAFKQRCSCICGVSILKGVLGKAKAKVSASIDKVGISMDAKKK